MVLLIFRFTLAFCEFVFSVNAKQVNMSNRNVVDLIILKIWRYLLSFNNNFPDENNIFIFVMILMNKYTF